MNDRWTEIALILSSVGMVLGAVGLVLTLARVLGKL